MTDEQDGDDRQQALMLLSQHGLSPNPEELEVLVAAYPVFRLLAAASYAVPGVRDAEPATTFAPAPRSSVTTEAAAREARGDGGR